MDKVRSQLESLNVIRPPLPASLPLNCCISWKNVGSCIVTVNDSHKDSSMWLSNAAGLPNSGRPAAMVSHSRHAPLRLPRSIAGGSVIEPNFLSAVMEPLVTNTRSPSSTGISLSVPEVLYRSEFTVIALPAALNPRLVTSVPRRNSTPFARSQLTSGTAIESYWL